MPNDIHLNNILFVDIETVSDEPSYDNLSPLMQQQWDKKAKHLRNDDGASFKELYFERAGIYAEFGRVVVISVGIFNTLDNGDTELRIKCISGENEAELLQNFKDTVLKFEQSKLRLCAHNGREFDFPYLCRRMLTNFIDLPPALKLSGKKSWEVKHIDTMDLWKFGDYKSFTPLDLLAELFNVEAVNMVSIDGSQVNHVYHNEAGLGKISSYCQRNVSMLAQVLLHLNSMPSIQPDNITMV